MPSLLSRLLRPGLASLALCLLAAPGCKDEESVTVGANPSDGGGAGSSGSDAAAAPDGGGKTGGGPVMGMVDNHCAGKKQATTEAACHADAGEPPAETDAGEVNEYGAPMFNSEADDDQCKYHVSFTNTPITQNADVFFTVTVKRNADGMPATGAGTEAQLFMGNTHLAPETNPTTTESPAGTYKIGPLRFDASGRWTARFHFYEQCVDGDESPHGHVSFFIDVP